MGNTVQLGKTGTPSKITPLPRCLQFGDGREFRRLSEIRARPRIALCDSPEL